MILQITRHAYFDHAVRSLRYGYHRMLTEEDPLQKVDAYLTLFFIHDFLV